jgi:hypothetical protein
MVIGILFTVGCLGYGAYTISEHQKYEKQRIAADLAQRSKPIKITPNFPLNDMIQKADSLDKQKRIVKEIFGFTENK